MKNQSEDYVPAHSLPSCELGKGNRADTALLDAAQLTPSDKPHDLCSPTLGPVRWFCDPDFYYVKFCLCVHLHPCVTVWPDPQSLHANQEFDSWTWHFA